MKTDVLSKLLLAGFVPTDSTLDAKTKQNLICTECNEIQYMAPHSKMLNFKKFPSKGCKICVDKRKNGVCV